MSPYRIYTADECGPDGYPEAWHDLGVGTGQGVKDLVRAESGHRCVRCQHPYIKGAGEWSPCDFRCLHRGPVRYFGEERDPWDDPQHAVKDCAGAFVDAGILVEARWRILTVHHLCLGAAAKRDLRWWNLVPLCQRDHLYIQSRVQMERVWPWPHSGWFQPYAAGWYAWSYLGEDLTRYEVEARLPELLALEQVAAA